MKNIGTRAEVFHGSASKTKGGLTKDDLRQNQNGYIVSKKQSDRMKGAANPLRQKGLLQKKNSGKFGPSLENKKEETKKETKEWSFF